MKLLSVSIPKFPNCFRTCLHIDDSMIKNVQFVFFLQKIVNSLRLNSTHVCTVTCAVWSGAPAVNVSVTTLIYQDNIKKAYIIISMCKISVLQLHHVELRQPCKKGGGRGGGNYSFNLGLHQ